MTAYDTALLNSQLGTGSGPSQTLAGYWPLDDGGSSSSFRDARPSPIIGAIPFSGTNGTLGSASIMPNDASTCLHKTGANSYALGWTSITGPGQAALQTTGPQAWLVWFQPDQLVGDTLGHQFLAGQWNGVSTFLGTQALNYSITGLGSASTSALLVPNNPVFYAAVYDGANLLLYLNGVLLVSQAAPGTLVPSTNALELGGILGGAGFHGYLQKLAYFTSAPSASQLQNLYIVGTATISGTPGTNFNVYPFSRQAVAANPSRSSISLTNISDTPMYLFLGTSAAAPQRGVYIAPNGGRWGSGVWKGAIQICHANWLGTKLVLISEV